MTLTPSLEEEVMKIDIKDSDGTKEPPDSRLNVDKKLDEEDI